MSLRERLVTADLVTAGPAPTIVGSGGTARDEIERNIHYLLIEELGSDTGAEESEAALRLRVERKLAELLAQETAPLSSEDRREITRNVLTRSSVRSAAESTKPRRWWMLDFPTARV